MLSFPRARDHMQVPQVNALKSCVVEPENQGITAVSISQKLMMEINIKVSSKSEIKRVRNLVPAPAVRLMRRRVLSRPGVNSLLVWFSFEITLSLDESLMKVSIFDLAVHR